MTTKTDPMIQQPKPGEVWQVDLGSVAKVRPFLVLSTVGHSRSVIAGVPCTATMRGGPYEIRLPQVRSISWERPTVANVEGLSAIPLSQCIRLRGNYDRKAIEPVYRAILNWLGYKIAPDVEDAEGQEG